MVKTTGRSTLLILILALGGLPATLAQTDSDESPPAPRASEDLQDAASATAERGVEPSVTPLEDYEASEQISEDLSVSFPVDI